MIVFLTNEEFVRCNELCSGPVGVPVNDVVVIKYGDELTYGLSLENTGVFVLAASLEG